MNAQHLNALDLADGGDWHGAHRIVQQLDDPLACWIHANLHREEGDLGNADYWYRRAAKLRPTNPVSEERAGIRRQIAAGSPS